MSTGEQIPFPERQTTLNAVADFIEAEVAFCGDVVEMTTLSREDGTPFIPLVETSEEQRKADALPGGVELSVVSLMADHQVHLPGQRCAQFILATARYAHSKLTPEGPALIDGKIEVGVGVEIYDTSVEPPVLLETIERPSVVWQQQADGEETNGLVEPFEPQDQAELDTGLAEQLRYGQIVTQVAEVVGYAQAGA
jgi:hypothetical protein